MSKELIDVLDENGVKTGEILSRDGIHKKGLWHRSIVVAIINDNTVSYTKIGYFSNQFFIYSNNILFLFL